ncbi:glycosyl transferase family 2 [Polaribacter pacificus]|uniref:Glycosyl transferase family 2 n=1 Tax=Polaribacter pacificus TaxID=1775173 RepID=A0A917I231_9FLAO|nr:glycosyltransferase [Polaribacter pacificus]GGH02430.1 glycosyl transferase family 2 [Polaribacter pacificus]
MMVILFYIFVAATIIQVVYLFSFSSVLFIKKEKKDTQKTPVSVIICAKNEEKNLSKFLPSILQQSYSNFEIILINDASSDCTLEVMEDFQDAHPNLKIVNVQNNEAFWGNKKYALTLGIKTASYEHLLFTDADCKPVSKDWIEKMVENFSEEKTIVLGYGKYKRIPNSFLNAMVRFETLLTAVQYFSYAHLGSPYMGVGRNLSYLRSNFFKTKGFISHIQVKSGDDDLFIQEAADSSNTAICLDPKSYTVSEPPLSWSSWFRQKRRHVSTSAFYKLKHQLLLGLYVASKFILYMLLIPLMIFYSWKLTTAILAVYYIILLCVFGLFAKKLHEKKLTYLIPLLEVCLLLFQFSIFISNKITKPTHWK